MLYVLEESRFRCTQGHLHFNQSRCGSYSKNLSLEEDLQVMELKLLGYCGSGQEETERKTSRTGSRQMISKEPDKKYRAWGKLGNGVSYFGSQLVKAGIEN